MFKNKGSFLNLISLLLYGSKESHQRTVFCCDLIRDSVSVWKALGVCGSAAKLGASGWTRSKPLLPCCHKMNNSGGKMISSS